MKTTSRFYTVRVVIFNALLAITGVLRAAEPADWRFHDDLLQSLVGKWALTGIVHGRTTKSVLEAEWVLQHQFLRVYQKSEENVPEINAPFEGIFFIGFDHAKNRYLAHFVAVWGGDDPTEGLLYGTRTGNELKLTYKAVGDEVINQRFTWDPGSKSWHIESRIEKAGQEDAPFLTVRATAAGKQ